MSSVEDRLVISLSFQTRSSNPPYFILTVPNWLTIYIPYFILHTLKSQNLNTLILLAIIMSRELGDVSNIFSRVNCFVLPLLFSLSFPVLNFPTISALLTAIQTVTTTSSTN
jgi:hypothetical protein